LSEELEPETVKFVLLDECKALLQMIFRILELPG
jgi:hypothetical protein